VDVLSWFWCIPLAERSILLVCCSSFVATLGTHIPDYVWLAVWTFVTQSRDGRRAAFLPIYGLKTIELVPDGETELATFIVIENLTFWIEMMELFTAGELNGSEPCDRWTPA